ncbi:Os01g0609501, partial [Oryza sativa Japonica Group]
MMPLTSWRTGMVCFRLGRMPSALPASSRVLVMELRTVGRPLLPTRTSASASRCSNRTSIVGMSIPTLSHSASAKLEEELLVVLVGDAHEALEERAALARAEPVHVHDALPSSVPGAVVATERQDGAAHAVVGGQLLERRPPQRLLVVLLPRRPR